MADSQLSHDTIHDLLSARRRRYALYYLYLYTPPALLFDVAKQVTEWEHGVSGADLLDEHLRTYHSLYHNHVPTLADADVVVYNQSEEMIELDRHAAQLRPYLERAAETDLNVSETPLMK